MLKDFEKVLISKNELDIKIKEIANKISADYEGKNPIFIGILKGSVLFMADLLKELLVSHKSP